MSRYGAYGLVDVNNNDPKSAYKYQNLFCRTPKGLSADCTHGVYISTPFIRELVCLSTCNHPNFNKKLGFDIIANKNATRLHLEREDIDLYSWIKRESLSSRLTSYASIFYQLAATLSAIHDQGCMYGDLSTTNIMLTGNKVKIIDYGSFIFDTSIFKHIPIGSVTRYYYRCNKYYTSPEMINVLYGGHLPFAIGEKHDVFSLGLVMLSIFRGDDINADRFEALVMRKEVGKLKEMMDIYIYDLIDLLPSNMLALLLNMLTIDPDYRMSSHNVLSRLKYITSSRPRMIINRPAKTVGKVDGNRHLYIDYIYSLCQEFSTVYSFVTAVQIFDAISMHMDTDMCMIASIIIADALTYDTVLNITRIPSVDIEHIMDVIADILYRLNGQIYINGNFDSMLRNEQDYVYYDLIHLIMRSRDSVDKSEDEKKILYYNVIKDVYSFSFLDTDIAKYNKTSVCIKFLSNYLLPSAINLSLLYLG